MSAFGTYDFETYDWISPLCADLYDGTDHTFAIDRASPTAVVSSVLDEMEASQIPVWWAHNGGKFDALFIVDCLKGRRGWKCDGAVANGRVISLRIMSPHHCWTLKDSYAVVQSGLAKALDSFDIPTKKVFTEADYKALETDPRAMCKHSDAKLRAGCQADTEGLWLLVQKAEQMFTDWGGSLKSTFSASALSVVKANIGQPLPSHEGNQWANDIARKSYCGGRVEVFKHMPSQVLREYDVTSSYPWSMTQPLPWQLLGIGEPRLYDADVCSIVYAKVRVPKQYLPPLPFVPSTGGLFFPWGEWSGWFAGCELRYAIEHCGVTATFHDALNYTVAQPFKSFVQQVFARKAASSGAQREFCKLTLNGCYGKFGQKPETSKLKLFPDAESADEWARAHARENPVPLNESETALSVDVHRWPKHTHYALASYVTAYSRILLHQRLMQAHDIAYCDTDSVHSVSSPVLNELSEATAADLGGLKIELSAYRARFYAPKLYELHPNDGEAQYFREPSKDDRYKPVFASKGFPVSADAFKRIIAGQKVGQPNGRMQGLKTQLRKDSGVKHLSAAQTEKRWAGRSVKRKSLPNSAEGDTEPWNVRELAEGAHEQQQSPLAPPTSASHRSK